MSSKRYPEEFRIEAVKRITEKRYSIYEVENRLGFSPHSLNKWVKSYGLPEPERIETQSQQAELRRLKAELTLVAEERDILIKASIESVKTPIPIKYPVHKIFDSVQVI